MSSFRRLTRDFTGRTEADLVAGLLGQIDATLRGADVARAAVRGETTAARARAAMSEIEHGGDEWRASVVLILSRSLTSPIDREDLFRLSRSIDDILDNLRDLVRELALFGLGAEPLLEDLLEAVHTGVTVLRTAVAALADRPDTVSRAALQAKKNEIRPRYQVAMAELLSQAVTGGTLKRRELLRRLDVVGLRLGEAADALADGAIKRNH